MAAVTVPKEQALQRNKEVAVSVQFSGAVNAPAEVLWASEQVSATSAENKSTVAGNQAVRQDILDRLSAAALSAGIGTVNLATEGISAEYPGA